MVILCMVHVVFANHLNAICHMYTITPFYSPQLPGGGGGGRGAQVELTDALHTSRRINWVVIVFKVASLL